MKIIFGTDGWRGLMDSEINEDTITLVAQAFADYNLQRYAQPAIVIGFDGRRNSEIFAKIFAETLSGNNIKVFLSDRIIPTPVLSFFVKYNKLNSGVMITASHNPPEYNGVKFKADYGGPFFTEDTLKIEELLGKSSVKKSKGNIEQCNLLLPYREQIENLIDFDVIRRSRLNILVDSMGGSGSDYLERILLANNIPAQTIFSPPDENFYGRLAEPIQKNLKPLSEKLKEGDYSIGLATDGDADRCGVMLDNGEWLSAQETILLLTDFIVNTKKLEGHIVKTASVTNKLKTLFESKQRKIYDVQVGFKYITEVMIDNKIAFGCEESGGFGYGNHIPERDGILSSLLMIEMLAYSGLSKLSEYVDYKREQFGNIFYDRVDILYSRSGRTELLPRLFKEHFNIIGNFRVVNSIPFNSTRNVINGLKYFLEGNNRWLLIRSSETEQIVRIYAEGQSDEEVKQFLDYGRLLFN